MTDENAIRTALETVEDPCSRLLGRPISIVDLGLVNRVAIDGPVVDVDLVLTVPNCIMFCDIAAQAQAVIRRLEPGLEVRVHIDTETPWTRERMKRR
jgi:metal-sulfur cluster biosynthetic enzyme